MKRPCGLALFLLLFAAVSPAAGAGEDSMPPSVDTFWADWNCMVRLPGWVRYHFTLHTFGQPFKGVAKIQAGGTYALDVDMPPASTREFSMPLLLTSQSLFPRLSLEDAEGSEVIKPLGLQKPRLLDPGEVVTGLFVAPESPDWLDPSRFIEKPKVSTVLLYQEYAPSRLEDLETADLIVLPAGLTLGEEAFGALLKWVDSGGYLFLPDQESLESGPSRRLLLQRLFPEFDPARAVRPEGVLEKWGVYDYQTIFLESLRAERGMKSPVSEGGWIAVVRRGAGGVILLTRPAGQDAPLLDDVKAAKLWELILGRAARFSPESSPPNPARVLERPDVVEPKLHKFFDLVSWPENILSRAETGVLIYTIFALVAMLGSLAFVVRKRVHFAVAGVVCVLGSAVISLGFIPRRTAVGETLEMMEMKNGTAVGTHLKLLNVASFTGSRVSCSYPSREGDRLHQVAYSHDDLNGFDLTWHFGEKVEIRNIRLDEGGHFLAAAVRTRFDMGSISARRISESELEIENGFKYPLRSAVLLKDGLFLPVGDFQFGDLPRRVDLKGEWIGLQPFLDSLASLKDPVAPRTLKTFFDEYYEQGQVVLVAFYADKSPGFASNDLLWKKPGLNFLYMQIPPR